MCPALGWGGWEQLIITVLEKSFLGRTMRLVLGLWRGAGLVGSSQFPW